MKRLSYILILMLGMSCSPGDRENKDLTDDKELNVSPNQTQSEAEKAKKDSASMDITKKDTVSH